MFKTQAQIINEYNEKFTNASQNIDGTKKLIDKYSYIRIGLFLIEVLFFVLLLNSADNIWRNIVQFLMVMPVLGFVFIVRKQSKLDDKLAFEKKLLWIYRNELNCLSGLENGYNNGADYDSDAHPYVSDLDIFGNSSLFELINRCSTKMGNQILAASLANKNASFHIKQRQDSIKEMTNYIDQTFEFRAYLLGYESDKVELLKTHLQSSLRGQLSFTQNSFLKFCVRLVPFITIFLLLGGIIFGGIFWKIFTILFLGNIAWTSLFSGKIDKAFYSFSGSSNLLNAYANAISWTERKKWKSGNILNLFESKALISEQIKSLSAIIQRFDSRLNLMIGSLLNALFLWDFRCCIDLDKWLQLSSKNVVSALNHLGDFEEIVSFATLNYNKPEWDFPEIEEAFSLSAVALGHPLIVESKRIVNDFHLEKTPTVDVITGSNMAGKSTFLRTLGINMVLAYAGAPVCAKSMNLSVFSINTYMRIKDSLNESTSTFKAELNRLKMILDNAVSDKDTFVLIDEMLRGTNSRDKFLGSKAFIEKLITEKIPTLFATHDLQLSDLKQKDDNTLRNYHFDITINNGEMMFDYKLKNGPCKTFNAAILLKEIGLMLN